MNQEQEFYHEENVDLRALIAKILHWWYIFPISLAVGIVIAFFINRYTSPVYQVSSAILIQDNESLIDPIAAASLGLMSNQYKVQNEIKILHSMPITLRTLHLLPFDIAYYASDGFTTRELYPLAPYIVYFDSAHVQPIGLKINIKEIKEGFLNINAEGSNVVIWDFINQQKSRKIGKFSLHSTIKLGDYASSAFYKFKIVRNKYFETDDNPGTHYSFAFFDIHTLVHHYQDFEIKDSKNSSVLALSIKGSNAQKCIDFLNKLGDVYLEKGIEKKNQIAINTISFIDSQLSGIIDSLSFSEQELQDFRSSNKLMNVDFQGQQLFTSYQSLQDRRAELVVKSKYFQYLKDNLRKSDDVKDFVAPASMGIEDATLNTLMSELINLLTEKDDMMANTKKDNPYITSMEVRIKNLKNNLIETIDNIIYTNDLAIRELDKRIGLLTGNIEKLPVTQRKLYGYERKYKFNDAVYNYLIQKRSEVQIAKASYLPDNEIVEPASQESAFIIAPNRKLNYIIALLLALIIPVGFILLYDYFNDKIISADDIEKLTEYPILGYILRNRHDTQMVVFERAKSLIAESMRSIRANLQFVAKEGEKHIIAITSSAMGEGKSFTAVNLGASLAIYNKKVVILNFDLRKPTIQNYFNIPDTKGISTFLSGNCSLDEIIFSSGYQNLDIVLAGPIPPNPSELIASANTLDMISALNKKYDYIIIDTPPVGVISDFLLLVKFADVVLYLVRHNYTDKRMFNSTIETLKKRQINNINIIVNDIVADNSSYSYSNGYGYHSGYDYSNENLSDDTKSLFLQKMYKFFKS
jgi:tyrosine-protein kinase Etk/Wzc